MARKRVDQTSAKDEVQPIIDCAHEGCGQGAVCRIPTKTGWAKLCLEHYESYYTRRGERYAEKNYLKPMDGETSVQYRQRMREVIRTMAKGGDGSYCGTWRKMAA